MLCLISYVCGSWLVARGACRGSEMRLARCESTPVVQYGKAAAIPRELCDGLSTVAVGSISSLKNAADHIPPEVSTGNCRPFRILLSLSECTMRPWKVLLRATHASGLSPSSSASSLSPHSSSSSSLSSSPGIPKLPCSSASGTMDPLPGRLTMGPYCGWTPTICRFSDPGASSMSISCSAVLRSGAYRSPPNAQYECVPQCSASPAAVHQKEAPRPDCCRAQAPQRPRHANRRRRRRQLEWHHLGLRLGNP